MTIYNQLVRGELPIPECSKTLGFELVRFSSDTASIEVIFQAKKIFLNPAGHVQGGFLCAMLDDVMGPALVFSLPSGSFAPTLEMNVQFLRPASRGEIKGFGSIVSKGRNVGFLEGRLEQKGKVVAKATATAFITQHKP